MFKLQDLVVAELIDRLGGISQLNAHVMQSGDIGLQEACKPYLANHLLTLIGRGDQEEAEKMLRINPDLLYVAAPFNDWTGRPFNCTAFEYAIWAWDKPMWEMILKYFPKGNKDAKAQMEALEKKGTPHGKHYNFIPLLDAFWNYLELARRKNPNADELERRRQLLDQALETVPAHIAQNFLPYTYAGRYRSFLKKRESLSMRPQYYNRILKRDTAFLPVVPRSMQFANINSGDFCMQTMLSSLYNGICAFSLPWEGHTETIDLGQITDQFNLRVLQYQKLFKDLTGMELLTIEEKEKTKDARKPSLFRPQATVSSLVGENKRGDPDSAYGFTY